MQQPHDWKAKISLQDGRARGHVSPTTGVNSHMVTLTHNPKKHPLKYTSNKKIPIITMTRIITIITMYDYYSQDINAI